MLCGHQFEIDEEFKDTVHMWLHVQPKTFSEDGIRKLVDWSNKCVEEQVDYVKKLQ